MRPHKLEKFKRDKFGFNALEQINYYYYYFFLLNQAFEMKLTRNYYDTFGQLSLKRSTKATLHYNFRLLINDIALK